MTEEERILHRLAGWSFYVNGYGEVVISVPGRDITQDINTSKLEKERDYLWGFMLKLKKKLENKDFVDKAPEEIVNKEVKKWNDSWERFDMIDKALNYLEKKNG
jgi:valyl-tRNA synthetase